MVTKSQEAYQAFCSNGYPYEDCVDAVSIAMNIVKHNVINPCYEPAAEQECTSRHEVNRIALDRMSLFIDQIMEHVIKTGKPPVIILPSLEYYMSKSLGPDCYNLSKINIRNFKKFYEHKTKKPIQDTTTTSEIAECFASYKKEMTKLVQANLGHYESQLQNYFSSSQEMLALVPPPKLFDQDLVVEISDNMQSVDLSKQQDDDVQVTGND